MNEMNNNQSLVQILINAGADVNAKNKYGLTPLHAAVLHQNRSVIDILIQAGADINAKSCLKRTALHFAISNYQPKRLKRTLPLFSAIPDMWVVEKLLDQENILVNIGDIRGETPLMWAVKDKQVNTVMALLKKGANPNIRNKDSKTPLHVALSAEDPCLYIVVPLLFHGASLNFEDKEGNTPIDILIQHVRNTQSYVFAYTCLETIALNHRIKNHQKHKLGILPQLWNHLQNCRSEVVLMRSDIIADRLTVFSFMLLGIDDSDFENPVLQVYSPVVDRLLIGFYPKYSFYILEHISKSNLSTILKITIDAKYCDELDAQKCKELSDIQECKKLLDTLECEKLPDAQDCITRSPTDFFSKVDIFILSKYLSHLDVFCLTVAFSKGKIHESMENIRKR